MRAMPRSSSIGKKVVMAVTGLLLTGFVIAHLAGNLLLFDPLQQAGNDYARWLREHPGLLWMARLGLLAVFVLHIGTGLSLARTNRAARPVAYARKRPVQSTFASRTMVQSGLLLLLFVLFHLAHFTLGWVQPAIAQAHADHDWHRMMVLGFQNPWLSLLYLAAMVVLGLHLHHGIASLFQSVGFEHRRLTPWIHRLGPLVGIAIAVGFGILPIAVLLGVVTP